MKFGIGEWAVVNGTVMKSVPGLVGKLVYIKELLTSGTYDYRVFDGDSEHTNVKEEELDKIPNSKLDTYLKFEECKKAKVKLDDEIVDILNINFNTEMVRVTNKKGLEVMFMLSALEPVESALVDDEDEDVSENNASNKDLHKQLLDEIHDTYVRKNADYGNSFEEQYKEYGLLSALIRFDDKIRRLKQLNKHEAKVKDESIRDSALDLANYAIMTVMELDKNKS